MSVLDVLRGAAQVGGAGFGGYAEDQQTKVRNALAQSQASRDAERDKVLNALTTAQTNRMNAPAPANRERVGGQIVDIDAGRATPIEGFTEPAKAPRTQVVDGQLVDLDAGRAAPIEGYKAPEPAKPNLSFQTIAGTDGQPPVVIGVDPKTGQKVSEVGPAKPSVAQRPTEAQMRANLVTPRAEQAAKDLMSFYESGAPVKTLAQKIPIAGNFVMNEEEQRMVQAAEVVAAAILRLESGAAVTDKEIQSTARQLIPQPGDTPQVLAQKKSSLEASLKAMRAQSTLGSGGSPAPQGGKPPLAERVQQLKSQGMGKEAARAVLAREGYLVGGPP